MKKQTVLFRGILAGLVMITIIFDTKTAVISAQEGVTLCMRTIIPSLFPFFVLTGVINSCLMGENFRFLRPLGRFAKIPKGAESLLILGFLAGYPIGAQLITQAHADGKLTKDTARRMLGFCNNAGPAFLFGMVSPLFSSRKTIWILWGIHIFSALIVGWILPSKTTVPTKITSGPGITFPQSLHKAIKATCSVCGWVILFRVIFGFMNRWFLWLFPAPAQTLVSGFLELSNGCIMLQNISTEGMRFLLAGAMLSFGGLCVAMQTMSVTEDLGTGWYFPGKLLQTMLVSIFSLLLQPVLFTDSEMISTSLPVVLCFIVFLLIFVLLLYRKKVVAFSGRLLYNTGK